MNHKIIVQVKVTHYFPHHSQQLLKIIICYNSRIQSCESLRVPNVSDLIFNIDNDHFKGLNRSQKHYDMLVKI